MTDTTTETPVQTRQEECEVLPDGRVGHFFLRTPDGNLKCTRCGIKAGRHGLKQTAA